MYMSRVKRRLRNGTDTEATMWICCKCQKIYQDYPPNSVCECGNEDDFEELEEEDGN